jgi:hypothetical protein
MELDADGIAAMSFCAAPNTIRRSNLESTRYVNPIIQFVKRRYRIPMKPLLN